MCKKKKKIENFTIKPPVSPLLGRKNWDIKTNNNQYLYEHCIVAIDDYFMCKYTDKTASLVYLRAKMAVEKLANYFGLETKEIKNESIYSDDNCSSS